MRILFVMWHPLYTLRLYRSTLRALAERGHEVHLGFTATGDGNLYRAGLPHLERLAAEHPNLTFGPLHDRDDFWSPLLKHARAFRTFLFYLHPRFRNAGKLLERARDDLHPLLRKLSRRRLWQGRVSRLAGRCLRLVERAVPSCRRVEESVRAHRPDVVVVTPLVHAIARQVDQVKAARRLGLPAAVAVASWDNLTTKSPIQAEPDLLLVWNEAQREEAAMLHGFPAGRVVVTGAQSYDHWFEQSPSTGREEFCRRCGLDPARPFVLYLCSSRFLQGDEAEFIDRWIAGLRASPDPVLRGAGALVRPYPTTGASWDHVDYARHGNVALWPRQGEHPLEDGARAAYFDSLYHSAAVVGANTSGLIEAAIVGRRCFSLLAPEFADKQGGTVHFHHLTGGGLLVTARTFAEHFAQLAEELSDPGRKEAERDFLRSFVRPWGLDEPATPRVVEAIERLAAAPKSAYGTPAWLLPLRWVLAPLVLLARRLSQLRRPAPEVKEPLAPTRRAA